MVYLLIILAAMPACVSDLDIKVPSTDERYIVEGWIELGGYAHVMVSRSLPYNSTVGTADLFNLLVDEAQVKIKCENTEERLMLVEDTMYSILPIYRGYRIRGEVGKSYTLEVKVGDQTFTSADNLLDPIGPDSLWFSPEALNDSLGYIHIRIKDPPAPGNYYRIFTKRLGLDIDYNGISIGALDDHLFNGTTFSFPMIRSGPSTNTADGHFFRKGQRVVVKTCIITKQYFDFISKVSNELGATLSPLSFQAPAITLMTGGALGGFGCYAGITDTLEIH